MGPTPIDIQASGEDHWLTLLFLAFFFPSCTDILLVPNGIEELSQAVKSLREDQQGKEKEKDDLRTAFFNNNIVRQKSL